MYPFVILSSLSVGFYLVMLVALHRDSKRHRRRITVVHPAGFTGHSGIRLARTNGQVLASALDLDMSGDIRWRPVTRVQWEPSERTIQINRTKPVVVTTPEKLPIR